MAITMKWIKENDDEYKGSAGYSEYRIIRRPGRLSNPNTSSFIYHGYKASKYIAQGRSLDEVQLTVLQWIKKNS